jgi:hypothetical protein
MHCALAHLVSRAVTGNFLMHYSCSPSIHASAYACWQVIRDPELSGVTRPSKHKLVTELTASHTQSDLLPFHFSYVKS